MVHDRLVLPAVMTQTVVKCRLLTKNFPKKFFVYFLTFLNCLGVTAFVKKIIRSTHFRLGTILQLTKIAFSLTWPASFANLLEYLQRKVFT